MKITALLAELGVIASGSAGTALVWNLFTRDQGGVILGILTFLGVAVIFFFYDDPPKGILREDVPLIIMCFVYEVVFMIVSAVVGTICLIPLSIIAKLLSWNLPGFADLVLSIWILTNLYLGWKYILKPKVSVNEESQPDDMPSY